MKKPIYKKSNDGKEILAFECTECEWQGNHEDKKDVYTDIEYGIKEQVCPKCDNPDFYCIVGYDEEL
ncbi:hypothetical protein INR75_02900 [Zunongwangia sp. SCSIO 43204]|uniref:hypothetical protein n=1 Tax=Zunongwangia sp. SCSIO 43204 TaxID=2779359 RepID=UPI001CA8EEE1|nr:hypothetical protein [Zunongwangia sp. SCSIO 43204]UAB84995.1 hypothetical protein INR75_02900 [Zunongwangia sp. SCSIO 43204]